MKINFHKDLHKLNVQKVGRKRSVKKEEKLLTFEWWFDKTSIRKEIWCVKNRTFVSIFAGRLCIGAVLFRRLNKRKQIWELSNAIITDQLQRCGIGSCLAKCSIQFAFNNGCKTLYLTAELLGKKQRDGSIRYEKQLDSRALKFWTKMQFKRVSNNEYCRALRCGSKDQEFVGCVPMKMTRLSRAAKSLPSMEDLIDELFVLIKEHSPKLQPKKAFCEKIAAKNKFRKPMVRLCAEKLDLCFIGK